MGRWGFVAAAVLAALVFAVSTQLKHRSATDVVDAHDLRPRSLGRLIRTTVAHRLWLAGIVADAVGLGLQLVALHLGPLTAVQPLLVLSLLFALVLGHHARTAPDARLTRATVIWAGLVVASLAGLLGLAEPGAHASPADLGPAIGICLAAALVVAWCVVLSRRSGGARPALLLGVAVGAIYAATAAMLKSLTDIAVADPLRVLTSWQLYVVVALGAAGLVLNQLAFQAGPLTASLPAISAVDPLLSIVIGVWVYDERLRHGLLADVGFAVLLAALVVGVVQLARSRADDMASGSEPQQARAGR